MKEQENHHPERDRESERKFVACVQAVSQQIRSNRIPL